MSSENFAKLKKQIMKEDLIERESLRSVKSIDQIKALTSVNRTHNELLHQIKIKNSKLSLKKDDINSESPSDTTHFEDTMNLFD